MPGLTRVSPIANQPLTGSVEFNQATAFGEFLRSARERRGLSLQQIAQETKIPKRHLISLEHGDLSVIPGPTYRRGEVVAYATVVGLDRAVALAELERVSPAAAFSDASSPPPPGLRRQHLGVGLLVVATVLGAVTLGPRVWKPAFIEDSKDSSIGDSQASSLPLVDHSPMLPQSASTAPQQATPARAELAPQGAAPPPNREAAATASSMRDVATLKRGPRDSLQTPATELAGTAAVGPSTANSDETSLVIVTEPAGARVTVDGIGWGATPVTLRNLSAGTKQIRVTKDGYTAAVRVARVTEQRRVTLTIPLRSSTR